MKTPEQQLTAAGVDAKRLAMAMNMQYLCYDIGSCYAKEVEHTLKRSGRFIHSDKQTLNHINRLHQKLTKSIDKTLDLELAESFGELSDYLQECLEVLANVPDGKRKNALKLVKTLLSEPDK